MTASQYMRSVCLQPRATRVNDSAELADPESYWIAARVIRSSTSVESQLSLRLPRGALVIAAVRSMPVPGGRAARSALRSGRSPEGCLTDTGGSSVDVDPFAARVG